MSISAEDFVECVDASPSVSGVPAPVAVGGVYLVQDVAPSGTAYRRRSPGVWVGDSLWLYGVNARSGGFDNLPLRATRFRKIDDPGCDALEGLRVNVNDEVPA